MSLADLLVPISADIRRLWDAMPRWYTGRVTQVSPLLVDAGGDTDVTPLTAGGWVPILGQPVSCLAVKGRVLAWPKDPAQGLASTGIIQALPGSGATAVPVTVDGKVLSLPWLAGYTPAVGDRVGIAWSPYSWGDGFVAGKLGQVPVPPPAPTVPAESLEKVTSGRAASGLTVVSPVDARTWRSGWRADTLDLVQGVIAGYPPNSGYLFYGDRFANAGVTVRAVDVYMHRSASAAGPTAAVAPVWQRHTSPTRGATQPTLTGPTVTGAAYRRDEAGWRSIPGLISVVQSLIDSGGGLALVSESTSNYSRWLSPVAGASPRDPMAGTVRYSWERT